MSPDDLDTLADLANLIGQRQTELRRMLTIASETLENKLNEIDRLMLAAARLISRLQGAPSAETEPQ